MFDILEADIVVMQELKIQRKDLGDDMVLLDDWDCFFSLPSHKKGQQALNIPKQLIWGCFRTQKASNNSNQPLIR
jgi:hypothetical protein